MSASALRYRPTPDRNNELRAEILHLAQRYRRYGAPMIYLKLRQAGGALNHKRVERLYAEQGLQIRRRRRKEMPISDRKPMVRSTQANEVWSMDFVFDRVADGRAIKGLGIVNDATHGCVALAPGRSISGTRVTRVLDEPPLTRGLPKIIGSDNGRKFIGKAMLNGAHDNSVQLNQIEPGKRDQNAYVESFYGRFRHKCLNERWFVSLAHAIMIIRGWPQEYHEERPKKDLSGLTPAENAAQMAEEAGVSTLGL